MKTNMAAPEIVLREGYRRALRRERMFVHRENPLEVLVMINSLIIYIMP